MDGPESHINPSLMFQSNFSLFLLYSKHTLLSIFFRRLYWSDWGKKNPKIESSNLDGSNRTTLVSTDIQWPNGVALDYKRRYLYWVDAGRKYIQYYNLVDKKRYKLDVKSPSAFGISVLGDMLYWTDMQQRSLNQWNINTKKQEKVCLTVLRITVNYLKLNFLIQINLDFSFQLL